MKALSLFDYESVSIQDAEDHDEHMVLGPIWYRTRGIVCQWLLTVFLVAVAFFLGMAVRFPYRQIDDACSHEKIWNSNLPLETSWVKYRGGLYAESPYRGTPNDSIDDVWDRYTANPWFDGGAVILGVDDRAIENSWKASDDDWINSTARLVPENGGGTMATMEVFHQLHCLNMIRKHSYPDYYVHILNSTPHLRDHLDHCIEMLRQAIMCHADTGLVVFHWVEGKQAAFPDFSTWHRCRNPEEILSWAHHHQAPMTQHIVKPDGAVEMPYPA